MAGFFTRLFRGRKRVSVSYDPAAPQMIEHLGPGHPAQIGAPVRDRRHRARLFQACTQSGLGRPHPQSTGGRLLRESRHRDHQVGGRLVRIGDEGAEVPQRHKEQLCTRAGAAKRGAAGCGSVQGQRNRVARQLGPLRASLGERGDGRAVGRTVKRSTY